MRTAWLSKDPGTKEGNKSGKYGWTDTIYHFDSERKTHNLSW